MVMKSLICMVLLLVATFGPPVSSRTAVILSGELRSANLTWASGMIKPSHASRMFGSVDPETPAKCLIEWLFKRLHEQGGLDVFYYVTASLTANASEWDGNPLFYQASLGDHRICEVFADPKIFNKRTGNHFFCVIEPEQQLLTNFLKNFTMWKGRGELYGSDKMNEQALQQYYGHYRGNLAAKQYALMKNITYTHKVRMRPDTPLTRPLPNLTTFEFNYGPQYHPDGKLKCSSTVYYPNKAVGGHNDWFNIGLAKDMDHVLDRYIDFISTSFEEIYPFGTQWNLEDHLEYLMLNKYSICLSHAIEIWMVAIRSITNCQGFYGCITHYDRLNAFDWVDVSAK